MVIGANPTDAHPVTGAKIKQQAMKGKTLIVIDPRRTELARYAKLHVPTSSGNECSCFEYDVILHHHRRQRT